MDANRKPGRNGQRPRCAGGGMPKHEPAVAAICVPIHAPPNDDDGSSVRRNSWLGDLDDFLKVAQLNLTSLSPCPRVKNRARSPLDKFSAAPTLRSIVTEPALYPDPVSTLAQCFLA